MKIKIYTDGACSGNPGVGGYSYLLLINNRINLLTSGGSEYTTNNRMELTAIVKSLESLSYNFAGRKLEIEILSDSAYCINSIEKGWINFWKENKWKTKQGDEVKNSDLWKKLYAFLRNKRYKITFTKVKGHSGEKYNELVDKKAKEAITRLNLKKITKIGEAKNESIN